MGFRNNNARDLPIDDEPAGIHVVVDGAHYSNGCCFNYGNASTNGLAVGTGTMESVYFGTSTGWGSGSGTGPWIMSDMEAGLFSGYNARVNEANPTITWRFVTGVFGGGGRNFWELKGGNAQQGGLQTFYAGVRPGSKDNSAYYPMHKKGAIQMGNGGDNGNGSAGTFYEGVMTAGHPGDGVADEVQANIVAARYDIARLTQTRLTSFAPNAVKEVTASFANTNAAAMENVRLTVSLPAGWTARASGPATFPSVAPGVSVRATFQVTAPARANMGYLTLRAAWNGGTDVSQQRVRSVEPPRGPAHIGLRTPDSQGALPGSGGEERASATVFSEIIPPAKSTVAVQPREVPAVEAFNPTLHPREQNVLTLQVGVDSDASIRWYPRPLREFAGLSGRSNSVLPEDARIPSNEFRGVFKAMLDDAIENRQNPTTGAGRSNGCMCQRLSATIPEIESPEFRCRSHPGPDIVEARFAKLECVTTPPCESHGVSSFIRDGFQNIPGQAKDASRLSA
jgi:hypothetical protein